MGGARIVQRKKMKRVTHAGDLPKPPKEPQGDGSGGGFDGFDDDDDDGPSDEDIARLGDIFNKS